MSTLPAAAAITSARLAQLAPYCRAAQLAPGLDGACAEFGIDTPARVRAFLGEVYVESFRFLRLVENLDYGTPERIVQVFPAQVPTLSLATPLVHNPEALADKVYGGRIGNSAPGDGWRYRGRGWLMITGRANYAAMGAQLGLDLVADPDLAATPDVASRAAAAWWAHRNLNALADLGAIDRISHVVNGGDNGLADRREAVDRAAAIWPG